MINKSNLQVFFFLSYLALDEDLCRVKVEYLTLPGWKTDTSGARKFADLPQNAQNYVHKIEELVGVPGMWISTTVKSLNFMGSSLHGLPKTMLFLRGFISRLLQGLHIAMVGLIPQKCTAFNMNFCLALTNMIL
jgi:hypothetical protein